MSGGFAVKKWLLLSDIQEPALLGLTRTLSSFSQENKLTVLLGVQRSTYTFYASKRHISHLEKKVHLASFASKNGMASVLMTVCVLVLHEVHGSFWSQMVQS